MKASETSWAQEAIRAEIERPADRFTYDGHDANPSDDVIYLVDRLGMCRKADPALVHTEHWRVQDSMATAKVAAECSANIQAGPAQARVGTFKEGYWYEGAWGREWRTQPYRSGCPGIIRDVFDEMTDQTTRRGGKAPLTAGQVDAGRRYRDLCERIESAGIKMSSAFDDRVRGRGKVDFMDAFMADCQSLEFYKKAIGDDEAMTFRETAAHSMDRGTRFPITDAKLVQMVCIEQKSLSAVLMAHGWALAGKNRKTLQAALARTLGRMEGIW